MFEWPEPQTIFISLVGGIIPAIIWLLFWIREDKKRPEPRGLIIITFISGMVAVPLVIPFQQIIYETWSTNQSLIFFGWAAVEELMKVFVVYIVALRRKEMDEPIDAVIYLLTAALGFTALENALYLFHPISLGNITETIVTSNVRFIGASLLHTLASAVVGIAIALSFYLKRSQKIVYLFWGIVLSIALHTAFNLFIIQEQGGITLATFGFVWIAIVILMLFFEKIKKVYPVNKL